MGFSNFFEEVLTCPECDRDMVYYDSEKMLYCPQCDKKRIQNLKSKNGVKEYTRYELAKKSLKNREPGIIDLTEPVEQKISKRMAKRAQRSTRYDIIKQA